MNPDDRLGEASKQAEIAQASPLADDHTAAMLENAIGLLERAQRRLKRRRRLEDADAEGVDA